jgi:hypothetical protein
MVRCDGLRLDDLRNNAFPHLFTLAETSALGLMNGRAPEEQTALATTLQRLSRQILIRRRTKPDSPRTTVDDPLQLWGALETSRAEFVVVQFQDISRLETERVRLSASDFAAARAEALRRLNIFVYLFLEHQKTDPEPVDLLLVALGPPEGRRQLTPFLATGPHFPPGLLTSPTTRTPGLVANTDLAPTLLRLLPSVSPLPLVGRPVRSESTQQDGPTRLAHVARIDYLAALNERALTRMIIPLGACCTLWALAGLVTRRRAPQQARWFAPGFVFTQSLPLALLYAPIWTPPTLLEYALNTLIGMTGITLLSYLMARLWHGHPALCCALLTLLGLMLDLCIGQPLLKFALFSDYPLAGIRYYGIGNEYLGIVTGFALMGGFLWQDVCAERPSRLRVACILLCWCALMFLMGWPGLGANAGSLIVTGAGFGMGAAILLGRRPTIRWAVVCMLGGLALAFGFGALETRLFGGAASHIGGSMQAAAGGRGPLYLAQIALRKIGMNLSLLATVPFALGLTAVGGTLLLAWKLLGAEIRAVLERRAWVARGLPAFFSALAASLLFKDSGVVSALFLAGSACLILFYDVLTADP